MSNARVIAPWWRRLLARVRMRRAQPRVVVRLRAARILREYRDDVEAARQDAQVRR